MIGIVVEKTSEYYKVDICGSQRAILPALAFEGATKRSRPFLKIGAVVYARVLIANKDMSPELTCISPKYNKDWVTGQAIFSELQDGYQFEVPVPLCKLLLEDNCHVLYLLGRSVSFELAIGFNGRVWIKSKSCKLSIILSNAIINSYGMEKDKITVMVQQMLSMVQ